MSAKEWTPMHEPSCTNTLVEAFREDPLMRTAIPSEADYNRIMPIIMYRTGLTLHSSFGMCDVFDEKGSAIAAAQWEPAKMTCMGGLRMLGVFPRMWWALGWGKGLIMVKLMLKLEKKRHAHAPTANHLMTLGTHSGHQGKGVGSKLIKRGIERATEAGCPCYLESSNPKNLPFYKRQGFVEVEKWYPFEGSKDGDGNKVEGKGPLVTLMIREIGGENKV